MKRYFTEAFDCGFLNFNTDAGIMEFLQSKAKEFFRDNSEVTQFSVAVIDFETRQHSIFEFDIETKITTSEY